MAEWARWDREVAEGSICVASAAACVVCGAPVCTTEACPYHPGGGELSDGRGWACSPECWEEAVSEGLAREVARLRRALRECRQIAEGARYGAIAQVYAYLARIETTAREALSGEDAPHA